jgi:phosphoribosylformylglycinamidine cyclo-ligase
MDKTFNLGIGMAAVVADADAALRLLAERGVDAWALGEVVPGSGEVRVV